MWDSKFPGIGHIVEYTNPIYCGICIKNKNIRHEQKFTVQELGTPYVPVPRDENQFKYKYNIQKKSFKDLLLYGPSKGPMFTAPFLKKPDTFSHAFFGEESLINFKKDQALLMHALCRSMMHCKVEIKEDCPSDVSDMDI